MSKPSNARPDPVVGPSGAPLTLQGLPAPQTCRWVARRKAEVVTAVRAGLLTQEEACRRYAVSAEEFASWERLIDRHGLSGLCVTRLQQLRAQDGVSRSGEPEAAAAGR